MEADRKHVENELRSFIEQQSIDSNELIDLVGLAHNLGFIVGEAHMPDSVDGVIVVKNDEDEILGQRTDKLIAVNSKHNSYWKRFTIAHEIGHYVLHFDSQNNGGIYAHRDHNNKSKTQEEYDADYFAASLLMPKKLFKSRLKDLKDMGMESNDVISILSQMFKCEEAAVKRRISEVKE